MSKANFTSGFFGNHIGCFALYINWRDKMKKLIPLFALLVTGVASAASAQPLMNYTYLDAAYQWTYTDEILVGDANGLDTKLSYSPIEHFALEGGYNYASYEFLDGFYGPFDIKQHIFTYGGAGWYTLQKGLDLVARVGGIHAQADSGFTIKDNGVYSGVTLRYLATDDLETDLNVLYSHINSNEWNYSVTGLYAIHTNVALKAEAGIDKDSNVALLAGVRLAI